MKQYDFSKAEKKWMKVWREEGIYEPDLEHARKPFYNLMMFPYPSAEGLHVGNMYAFTGTDIYGRFKRMQGHDVFEPIGLDGFGIHSENYALKIGTHPLMQSKVSEERFYKQLEIMGNGFAWNERLETYDPEYYQWTQWIFVEMWKHGLAYRKKQAVNWCPSCKTVLADEQVEGGKCERCDTPVVKKELEQWFFRITEYAERLLRNIDAIDWSEKVKIAQRNWIGRSEGALIKFKIQISKFKTEAQNSKLSDASIEVFTTRPDTLFGATYLVLAPEHPMLANGELQIANREEVEEYVITSKKKSEEERVENKEKTGVELKGIKAVNPANGEELPVFVADYVLSGYGTGAIMAVPAHDERDFEFANKHDILIRKVIVPKDKFRAIVITPTLDNVEAFKRELGDNNIHFDLATSSISGREHIQIEFGDNGLGVLIKLVQKHIKERNWVEILGSQNIIVTKNDIYPDLLEESDKWFRQFQEWEPALKGQKNIWELLRKNDFFKDLICFKESGILINSGKFNGMASEKAKEEITKFAGGEKKTIYRLRDWLISRQRYWGPPIPIIYCRKCWELSIANDQFPNESNPPAGGPNPKLEYGVHYTVIDGKEHMIHPVPEEDLPVKLPMVKNFRPQGKGESPLASVKEFYETTCPACGGPARRETDVSDTFLDSAWYYIGYLAHENSKFEIRNSKFWNRAKRWFPVGMYIGGAEHSVLHLLYVRFVALALRDMKLLDFPSATGEPFPKFRAHGLVIKDGAKMSKSKGNVVNPDEYIKRFGADAFRMYLMFLAPFEQGGDFRDQGILGTERFLQRVWKLAADPKLRMESNRRMGKDGLIDSDTLIGLNRVLHQTIKKVTEDIEELRYNTAISALMILLNEFEKHATVTEEHYRTFLKLLAPFAPFLAEELWQATQTNALARRSSRLAETTGEMQVGEGGDMNADERGKAEKNKAFQSIHREAWPAYDPKLLVADTFTLVIQVNGKVRDQIEVPRGIAQKEAEERALASEKVRNHFGEKTPKKTIYVPGKLLNFVV